MSPLSSGRSVFVAGGPGPALVGHLLAERDTQLFEIRVDVDEPPTLGSTLRTTGGRSSGMEISGESAAASAPDLRWDSAASADDPAVLSNPSESPGSEMTAAAGGDSSS